MRSSDDERGQLCYDLGKEEPALEPLEAISRKGQVTAAFRSFDLP